MTNQSNPSGRVTLIGHGSYERNSDQVSRLLFVYRLYKSAWIKACILHRYTFWVLFLPCLWVWRALLGIRISPHYQWWFWVSISTKSLTLHYSGQAMHPHHNRDGEHVYTYAAEREVQYLKLQKGKKWSPSYCSHGLHMI